MVDIEIYGSGSSGNCALINGDIIVDLGVRKARIPDSAARRASAVLVTHEHSDHLLMPTFRWFAGLRPDVISRQFFANRSTFSAILCGCGPKLRPEVERIPDANTVCRGWSRDVLTRGGVYHVEAFDCPHGYGNERYCENYGFTIETPAGDEIVWATDTTTMDYCPDRSFDAVCVEGNYSEYDLSVALANPAFYQRARSNLRHLSVEQFERFALAHSKDGAKIVQLHMSEDFGRRSPVDNYDWGDLDGGAG